MRSENRALLGSNDVVLYAHPGSGTSWIGTLLVQLGIFYASGNEERLIDSTSQHTLLFPEQAESVSSARSGLVRPSLRPAERARHLPLLSKRDNLPPNHREATRVILTNDSALGWTCTRPVVLLVRDGRDTLLSLYHHLRGFGGLQVSFEDYLDGGAGAWPLPAHSWAIANLSWLESVESERLLLLRFEDCRADPQARFGALLDFLGIRRTRQELERAIEAASFDSMRRAEELALGEAGPSGAGARHMRSGKIGEWREAYDKELLQRFSGLPRRALERFGYPSAGIP